MSTKQLPFTKEEISSIIEQYPTPFHIYDEKAIRENARRLLKAFSWNPGFKEYFAVKATPNPFLLKVLKEEGFGADCSSYPEMVMADSVGITGENIMFTSNNTSYGEYKKAREMGAVINLDDISHIKYLEERVGLPELVCFRYNPGPLKAGNAIIGNPEDAKYGFTKEQLFQGYKILKDKGIKRFGLHTMVASNELDVRYFIETAQILFDLALELSKEIGITFEFVNLGGGIGIPYRPEQKPVDLEALGAGIHKIYKDTLIAGGHPDLKVYLEAGRVITGPYGYLVTEVLHIKDTYKKYAGLDASMPQLMRPAMYGAYHHVTVMGKENLPETTMYDVTGSLCENNDKFAIDRMLPELEQGDIVVIHDAGAHGHSMGFNYNAKLKKAELLLRENREVVLIRREENIEDYFATLDFEALKKFEA